VITVRLTDGGRSFKAGGQESDSGDVFPEGSGGKFPGGRPGEALSQKLTTLFMKMCYFVTVLRMTAMFALIAYKCSISNGRQTSVEAEKW